MGLREVVPGTVMEDEAEPSSLAGRHFLQLLFGRKTRVEEAGVEGNGKASWGGVESDSILKGTRGSFHPCRAFHKPSRQRRQSNDGRVNVSS